MDDYLSDKEELERIRDWWREYGWYLLGGVVLGAGLLYGKTIWDDFRIGEAQAASAIFQELRQAVADDADADAVTLLEELRTDYPSSPYADQAGLVMVLMYLQNGSPRQAIESLEYTLANTDDEYLAMIVRTRIARLMASSGRNEEAVAILDSVDDPGIFSGRFSDIRGDIHYAEGDIESARSAWFDALNSNQSELVDRVLLQMKLDDLPPDLNADAPDEVSEGDAG